VPTDALVSAEWLRERLGDVRLLDVRGRVVNDEPRYRADPDCYRDAHIPGAVFVDWRADFTDRSDPVPVQLAPRVEFAADATRLGIGNDSVVVAYDNYRNVLAGRVVWAFRAYSHRRAHVLDGGLGAWRDAGGPLRSGEEHAVPAVPPYRTGPRDDSLWDIDRMRSTLDGGVLVIDARAHDEYVGVETHARRAGHIPGAVNVPYRSLLRDDGPFLERSELRMAFADAGIDAEDVGYVNAHGTSTPAGDSGETRVLKVALGEDKAYRTPVSSTKGATGHCLGAAGAVEAIFTILALQRGILPPTINQTTPDPDCDLDYIPNEARHEQVEVGVSNSFGFGGHNACLVFRRWHDD
jgi:3-oxoacyl-(acyl-carrier-protein) synthase